MLITITTSTMIFVLVMMISGKVTFILWKPVGRDVLLVIPSGTLMLVSR